MHRTSSRPVASIGLAVVLAFGGLVATALPAAGQAAPAAAGTAAYPANGRVTVRQGDTLYSIAERTLGDGTRYVEIFERNRGVAQSVGGTLTDPGILRVGWVLRLPPLDGGEPNPDDSPGSGRTYTVRAGDSLSGIARSQLGDASRFDEIFDLNVGRPQVGGGSLSDPAVLRVGWVLELPRRNGGGNPGGGGNGGGSTPPVAGGRYTVQQGDSLSSIAEEQLGDGSRYLEIFELNEGVAQSVGGTLTDPGVLRVGWILRLPAAGGGSGGGSGGGAGGGGGTGTPAPGPTVRYTVAQGDSLTSIAADRLGDARRWREIFELNDGVAQAVGGSLSDPAVLRVGWILRLPAS